MAHTSGFPDAAKDIVDPFEPTGHLRVAWGETTLEEGIELTPTIVQHMPDVKIEGTKDALYTIIFSDPDAPSAADPKFKEWQHWILINASLEDPLGTGHSSTAYVGSAPGKDSGMHRYVFVLYEQGHRIELDTPDIPSNSGFPPRRSFNSREFARKHGLKPVAVLTYRAQYDDMVPELHKRIQAPAAS